MSGFDAIVLRSLCRGDVFGAVAGLAYALYSGASVEYFGDFFEAVSLGLYSLAVEASSLLGGRGSVVWDYVARLMLEPGVPREKREKGLRVLRELVRLARELREKGFEVEEVAGGLDGGGLEGLVAGFEALVEGLESGEWLGLGLVGVFEAGVYRRGAIRVCNKLPVGVGVESVAVKGEGVEAFEALGRLPGSLGPGECAEIPVSVKFREGFYGDIPVAVTATAKPQGVEEGLAVEAKIVVEVERPSSLRAPGGGGGREAAAKVVVEQAPTPSSGEAYGPDAVARVFVGKVLSVELKPIEPSPLPRPVRISGYEARGVLGAGGFAVTLLAVDSKGRPVVLKLPVELYPWIAQGIVGGGTLWGLFNRRGVEAFLREARVLEGLRHPHIVRLLGSGVAEEFGGAPYVAIEYCGGGSLRTVLEAMGEIGVENTLLLGVQVADALAYLHSKKIVHRDLKPENILFTENGLVKITDFNISKIMRTTSSSRAARSYTPGYAAPEQVFIGLGRTGPWTDTWSLGAVLYEAATGEPLFDLGEYEDQVRDQDYVDERLGELPEPLREPLRAMLRVDPRERIDAVKARNQLAKTLQGVLKRSR